MADASSLTAPLRPGARLDPLLAPKSVALLGASTVPDSFGWAMLDMARAGGFAGPVHPVNPRYAGTERGFFARLSDLPEPVEHVVLGVANERLEACLTEAAEHGAKAVTIFADGKGPARPDRIRAIAREAGMQVCGPNSMGFHNLDIGLRISPFPAPKTLVPGGIAAILQSGSIMGALAHNDRRLRFNMLVSPGSEYLTTAADYLDWALDQKTTRVVGLFLEAVRDPETFLAALDRAEMLGIPVAMLKVGRTDLSRKMAQSHTGALVGDHDVFEAAMRERGVHLTDTVDELAATLQLFAMGKPAAPGAIAALHDSGGERELLVDTAERLSLPLARFAPETVARIERHLEPGLHAENPLDAWASGKNAEVTFLEAARAMMDDPGVAVGLYVLDWRQDYYLHAMHARVLIEAAKGTEKPLVALSNYSLTVNHDLACQLADHGIALLDGTEEGLKAVRHLLSARDRRPVDRPVSHVRTLTAIGEGEAAGLALLATAGIDTPDHGRAATIEGTVAEAARIGYPVALKTAAPGIAHKTEAQGVALNLRDEAALRAAYADMAARLGPEVIVAAMVTSGAEWSLGVINDRDFGPAVMIAPGGVMVELLPERAVLMAPFTADTARAAILTLRASRLLTGYRGQAPLALDALAGAAACLSQLAHDARHQIEEMDVNPVIVTLDSAVAVDVLITPRDRGQE
ncbi:MAG: acetate--CoA ligase family protein [Albidovulum sp.]|uniref:acetate--CoA ligase family protein n=1 Tax=Albidovulum sp. TaxID=1872424 RepID=UPI003CA900DF